MATCDVCDMRIDTDLMVKHYALCDDDLVGGTRLPYNPSEEEEWYITWRLAKIFSVVGFSFSMLGYNLAYVIPITLLLFATTFLW